VSSASERAYHLIRADILSGALPGGTRLGENALAEQYGLSRTPIRESLRRLQAEGLIESTPNRGARVLDWSSFDVATIYDLRALIEGFIVRRAAVMISDAEIERLTALCEENEQRTLSLQLGSDELIDQTTKFNTAFHGAIALAAGGEIFANLRSGVVLTPLMLRTVHDYTAEDRARTNHHHRELLAAFRARSSEWAESVMLAHVFSAKSRLLGRHSDRVMGMTRPADPRANDA
jgi:DNA-binding GntR family transcriptional regulator